MFSLLHTRLLHLHIIGLACDDDAYRFSNTNPRTVLTLGVLRRLNCQPIPWKEDILEVPICCSDTSTAVTLFGPANPALFPTPNVRQSRLTV